jgi:methionyl-tRNA formyltransferase
LQSRIPLSPSSSRYRFLTAKKPIELCTRTSTCLNVLGILSFMLSASPLLSIARLETRAASGTRVGRSIVNAAGQSKWVQSTFAFASSAVDKGATRRNLKCSIRRVAPKTICLVPTLTAFPPIRLSLTRSRSAFLYQTGGSRSHSARHTCFSSSTNVDGVASAKAPKNAVGSDEPSAVKTKRIVFLGTPDVAAATLRTLVDVSSHQATSGDHVPYEIVGVVTQPPKRRKRKGGVEPSPVGKVADEFGIPVLSPEKARDADFLDKLATELRPDLCITAAYGQYLPKRFLTTPELGTINIHPSLLPKWRGASPVQRSLEAGDNPVGVTLLYTVSAMDAGPIVAQEQYAVKDDETATTLLPLLFEKGTKLLLDALPSICSGAISFETATPQDEKEVTQAAMIDASEAELKFWEHDATTCHNRVRGFAMWPQTFIYISVENSENSDGSDVSDTPMILKVKVTQTRVVGLAGTAELTDVTSLGPTKQSGLYCVCHDGSVLELLRVQPATRKEFNARDLQNGYPGQTLRWVRTPEQTDEDDQAKFNSRKS